MGNMDGLLFSVVDCKFKEVLPYRLRTSLSDVGRVSVECWYFSTLRTLKNKAQLIPLRKFCTTQRRIFIIPQLFPDKKGGCMYNRSIC